MSVLSPPLLPHRRLPLALPQDNNGWTALILACLNNAPECAQLLVAKGADVNAKVCGGVDVEWGWHVRRVGGAAAVGGGSNPGTRFELWWGVRAHEVP